MANISIWNRCNSNCVMCTNPFGYRKREDSAKYSKERVLKKIERNRDLLKNNPDEIIHFTGGEPTIHPHFLDIIKETRRRFPQNRIVIASNGRRFFYEKFTKSLLNIDNLRIEIAVHAGNEKLHDSITRSSGSFNQTIEGLKNIFKYKNDSHLIEIRHVLLKMNYKKLDETYDLLSNFSEQIFRMVTIFPELEGRAEKNIETVGLTYKKAVPFIQKATDKWADKFDKFHLYHFPLCVIDKKYWGNVIRSLPREEMIFEDKCNKCIYKDYCLGIHSEYKKNVGVEEFTPIREKKSGITINEDNYWSPIIIN